MASARSAPTFADGRLFIAGEDYVYVLDPGSGKELSKKRIGGRMGIISPTIVGGTLFLANSWDWILAMPLSLWQVRPSS